MSLEKSLERIADALEKLAEAGRSSSVEFAALKKEVEETIEPVTEEEVKEEPTPEAPVEAPVEEEDDGSRKVFTKADPPKTQTEIKLFKKQWDALGKENQATYLEGKIDSLKNEVEKKGKKKTTVSKKAASKKKADPKLTKKDVTNIIQELCGATGGDEAAIKLLDKFGSKNISGLDEKSYAPLIKEAKETISNTKSEDKQEDDGDLFA